jgi:hypothetical protein
MSDDYNSKVASSELAKLGIVEKQKELDRVVPDLVQESKLCTICEGKGYVNLSDTDNVDSRVDCDECSGSGVPLSQDERDYINKEYQHNNKIDSLFDDELPIQESAASEGKTNELTHTNLKEKYASLEPYNSDVTTGTHNQWSKDSVAEKLEEIKDNYKVQEGECTIEPKDMSKIVDLLRTNFGDLVEHAGFVFKTKQAPKIIGDLIEDFIIKETTHNNSKIIVDRND